MQFFLGDRISQHMARLKDGSLLCTGVPLARTGTQKYRATELASAGGILPDGMSTNDMVPVFRPAAEVLSARTMASLEGCVLTDNHPPQFVSPANFAAYQMGHVQNIREGPRTPEGESTLVGDLLVRDAGLADKIERGLKRQVSVGYSCLYSFEDGRFVQRGITANHVAIVPVARGGDALQIMDAGQTYQRSTGGILKIDEAIQELSRITALLERHEPAKAEDANDELACILRDEELAREFADAANRVGARMRSREDCRPGLRIAAEERRAAMDSEITPDVDAAAYADSMRVHLRK